jgi:hypothetical protein
MNNFRSPNLMIIDWQTADYIEELSCEKSPHRRWQFSRNGKLFIATTRISCWHHRYNNHVHREYGFSLGENGFTQTMRYKLGVDKISYQCDLIEYSRQGFEDDTIYNRVYYIDKHFDNFLIEINLIIENGIQ